MPSTCCHTMQRHVRWCSSCAASRHPQQPHMLGGEAATIAAVGEALQQHMEAEDEEEEGMWSCGTSPGS
jgi:hypothetical protein